MYVVASVVVHTYIGRVVHTYGDRGSLVVGINRLIIDQPTGHSLSMCVKYAKIKWSFRVLRHHNNILVMLEIIVQDTP